MRARVVEKQRERALAVAMQRGVDAGGFARGRASSVGADDQPGRISSPVGGREFGRIGREVEALDLGPRAREARASVQRPGQQVRQRGVLDVPAERVEFELRGVEFDRARGEQRAGVVDDAQRTQRRRSGLDLLPNPEFPQQFDRASEQGDRAALAHAIDRAAGNGGKAGARQAYRRRRASQSGADDECVASLGLW